MQSKLLSRRDIEFMLYEWLDVEALNLRPRFQDHNRESFDAAIATAEQIATELFAPHNKKSDQQEPHAVPGERSLSVAIIPEVKTALDAFSAAGLMAAGQDFDVDGMQLPAVVEKVLSAYFTAANVATAAYIFLTVSNANTLLKCGTPEQVRRYVLPMFAGKFFGTMCLSEPQAGSSLSDITTRAEPDPVPGVDGERQFRLTGNKMWISAGEHDLAGNIIHFVLAKIPGPDGKLIAGVKGISLFIVPKFLVSEDGTLGERNDVVLAGLNHKMGNRGTSNCLLNFGEGKYQPQGKGGAIGYLVGQPHQGLANMFHMMNEARIGVGLGAAIRRRKIRPGRSCPSSSTPTCGACCWRRRLMSRAASGWCSTARAWSTSSRPRPRRKRVNMPAGCSISSRRSPSRGRRSGASRPTAWRSRCMAATVTRTNTTSSSFTVTTASTRSTKARTAFTASTCWDAR